MTDFFNFEDKEYDIPFYNGTPKISGFGWALLILGLLIFVGVLIVPISMSETVTAILLCLGVLIPTLIVLKGNWNLMFRKIRRQDIKIILIVVVVQIAYSLAVLYLMTSTGLVGTTPADLDTSKFDLIALVNLLIQLVGEELYKIILLIVSMFVFYKFINRKKSIVLAIIVTTVAFGLIHAGFYGNVLNVILIQGVGSIFVMLTYIKTKNVMVSYVCHVLYDVILMAPSMF